MLLLIKSLTILLSLLLFYHFYNVIYRKLYPKEGMDVNTPSYQDPGLDKNPTYLAITNAANITFLKKQIDDLTGLKQTVNDLSSKVDNNSKAIIGLGESLKTTSQQITGRDADSKEPVPQATGLNYGNMTGVENSF